ncbi:TonB-dependent receptor [Halioxenophilus aromaticivorans]|uniref:TonB-dependent receptor n=1 Tax=Halioxenophilus aromaticivorans TaxID=1306992 RepID=A0AAV3TVH5_9ALTE
MSFSFKKNLLASCVSCCTAALAVGQVHAQETGANASMIEEVVVTSIRRSLEQAQDLKRDSVGVMDAISAEGLGKFPDTNIAESLQRIPGVAIDRNGGEGQYVTVRGFGPSFNTVLVNGRRIVSETGGRQFSFDLYPAELISGAQIYKSGTAHLQEGGIGSTINLETARPLKLGQDQYLLSGKALMDDNSGENTPQLFGLVSKIINDGNTGVLFSVSYQERESQEDYTNTNGWIPTEVERINFADGNSNPGNVSTAFIPRETQTGRRTQSRERTNIQAVVQHDFSDELRMTVDGFYNEYEVESSSNLLGSWFGDPGGTSNVVLDNNGTVLSQDIASEVGIMNRLEGRPTETKAIGFNLDWAPTDELTSKFDASWSQTEAKQGNGNGQAVMGFTDEFSFINTGSESEIIYPAAVQARLLDKNSYLSHVAQFGDQAGDGTGGNSVEGEVFEFKFDNVWEPTDGGMLSQIRFGASYSEEDKTVDIVRPGFGVFCLYCFFSVDVPNELILNGDNSGLLSGVSPNTFRETFAFNLADYIGWQSSPAGLQALDACNTDPNCNPAVPLPAAYSSYVEYYADQPGGFFGTQQPDSFNVKENIFAMYTDMTLDGELFGDWAWTLNAGLRYVWTENEASGAQQTLIGLSQGTPTQYAPVYAEGSSVVLQSATNDYKKLLPNLALTLKPSDNLNIKFAMYETMSRPELADLAPRFSYADLRPNNINAFGGNVELEPYTSTNWDLGVEYYWGELNYVSAAYFEKEVRDFVVVGSQGVTVDNVAIGNLLDAGLADGLLDPAAGTVEVNVQRPLNSETAKVDGIELSGQYVFEMGLGFSANATFMDSNAGVSASSPLDQAFAIPGLGDSMNATVFYETEYFEARLSWSWRDQFLEHLVNPKAGVEPVFVEEYEQIDARVSYHINDSVSVFLEGTNIGDEEIRKHGRFDDQFIWYSKTGPRYALGFRAQF